MKDLLEEVRELEKSVALAKESAGDCAMQTMVDQFNRMGAFLEELLEIKKARLSVEVFMDQEYNLVPDEETLGEEVCHRCGKRTMTDRGPKMICSNCGAVRNNK